MEGGAFGDALRWADRAQRHCPESAEIAELKARLLLRQSAADDALEQLLTIERDLRTPAVHALLADVYFALGRDTDGLEVLQGALTSFAVSPGDALADCASRYCAAARGGPRGWIALGPDFRAWGGIASGAAPANLSIALSGRTLAADLEAETAGAPSRAFSARLAGAGQLTAQVQGAPLLGSGLAFPPDVRADGRCFVDDGVLHGWVSLNWAPQVSPTLVVRDRLREVGRVASKPSSDRPERREFSFRIPRLTLGRELTVAVALPGDRFAALPGSPALIGLPPPPGGRRRKAATATGARSIDVIVPVYDGHTETLRCLHSVQATCGGKARLIIVNDASPNAPLADDVRAFSEQHGATLIENARNLGFAASVNRALQVNPTHDAVVLNADAEVFPGWLDRLKSAADSAPDIGTVTPLGEAAAIATYPRNAARSLESAEAGTISRLAAIANADQRVETPTGVGFCLYLRRDCLDQTGDLDERVFGRGYGEENDFCLRATALGWRHLIATDVFVGHQGSRSFGAAAVALRERNGRVLSRRHPDYAGLVEAFQARDPLRAARRRLDEARLEEMARPFQVLVSLADPGGVDRVIERRCREIAASGGTPLVLRPEAEADIVRIGVPGWEDSDLSYDADAERTDLLALIAALAPQQLELHHYYGHDSTLIDELIAICGPLTVFVHDYSLVCPRLVLVGGSGRYCGEPDLDGCDACVAANGSSLREAIATAALRRRSAVWLNAAAKVVAPSLDTKLRLRRYFPDVPIEVEAWETDSFDRPAPKTTVSQTIKVAVIGAIGVQKGYRILLECARDAAERLLPVEFVVIGYTVDDDEWLSVGNTFVTGRFGEDDIQSLIRRESPDVAFFASVSPETHCFSLTHALRARLPVVAFDFGAIAERLRGRDTGATLLPFDSGAAAINNALLAAVLKTHGGPPPRRNALIGPRNAGSEKTERRLPAEVGPEPLGSGAMATTSSGLTASPQLLTLARGIYSFSVKSAAPRRTTDGANLMLPALHVALAPGVPPENAEILTGLRADGAWLYDTSDVVLAKVKVAGSSILVTSYSMPGLTPLSIEIEQVDARSATSDKIAGSSTLLAPPPPRLAPSTLQTTADSRRRVALSVDAHIGMVGDVTFSDTDWVGAIAEGLPIEALRINSLERLADGDIEYKGLTADGAETRWCAGGELCGVKGQAAALTGFLFRLKGRAASLFECHYTARFGSGVIVGPLAQGVPARGRGPDDFVVGLQLVIVETTPSQRELANVSGLSDDRDSRPTGPRFSTFREEIR